MTPFSIASFTTRSGSISPATACDAYASTKHQKRGYRHSGPSQKTHHRPSYGLASLPRCLVLHLSRYSPASRSLATALPEGASAARRRKGSCRLRGDVKGRKVSLGPQYATRFPGKLTTR